MKAIESPESMFFRKISGATVNSFRYVEGEEPSPVVVESAL
jgi:hypothetical protein